ncbi:oxidoreductase [Pseudonocardia eucalypti]
MFGPIETNLGRGRGFTAEHVGFYAARGGAGVIVTEVASVHPSDWPYESAPLATECAPGWAEIVRACRSGGALVLAGLGHAGGQGTSAHHERELWAPSPVPDPRSREVPAEMSVAQIDEVVAGFAAGAELAVAAGCAGVEVDAGEFALLRQFASGLTNRRADGYGADRTRLLREVVAAVRAAVGSERVVGLRLSCDELVGAPGITPDVAVRELVPAVAAWLDYLVPVRGGGLAATPARPDAHTRPGFNRALCDRLRGVAPALVLQGSVVDVAMAEASARAGVALVEMTRAQLAEPDLVALLRAGTPERIRPCLLTNQYSAVRDPANVVISDEGEPRTGHETTDPLVPRGPFSGVGEVRGVAGRVLVVGGGPAGCEAARVAAALGLRVRLVERAAELGGAMRLAARLPGLERYELLVEWWRRELNRLGVEVRLGCEADLGELLAAERAGVAVLVATGSVPREGVEPAWEFLAGERLRAQGAVTLYDPVGGALAIGLAELLAGAGRAVTLVTPDAVVGARLPPGSLVAANTRLARAGVTRVTDWRGPPPGGAIDCGHRLSDDTFPRGHPRAGDAVAPRNVHQAVLEGRRFALSLVGRP